MSSKTALPVIFGAMTFGREGEEQVRTSKLEDCATILDTFKSFGHNELDTSRFYGVRPLHADDCPQSNINGRADRLKNTSTN
jgi:aryl-alcohol dehydrogenase-like predicted oxidoreductase